jgi:hypothetical protein
MGKTYVAAAVIARLGLRCLYIVPKRPLATQAQADLLACYSADDDSSGNNEKAGQLTIGQYSEGPEKVEKQDITIIVINSAMNCSLEFFEQYSFIVYDEAHCYCTANRRGIYDRISIASLGLSATTSERLDGFDPIAHKALAFDGILFADKIPGFVAETAAFECTARVLYYSGPPSHTINLTHEKTGEIFTHYMYNQFISDPYRLSLAVSELTILYDWRGPSGEMHYIYVFAEEVDILRAAYNAFKLSLSGRRADIERDMRIEGIGMFTGGMRTADVAEAVAEGRVLFSTYSFAGTGVSIQRMSAMLLLTPRKSGLKQVVARILRRGSDTTIPRVVVDIVDHRTCLKHQVLQRKIAYDFYGFRVEPSKVDYKSILA